MTSDTTTPPTPAGAALGEDVVRLLLDCKGALLGAVYSDEPLSGSDADAIARRIDAALAPEMPGDAGEPADFAWLARADAEVQAAADSVRDFHTPTPTPAVADAPREKPEGYDAFLAKIARGAATPDDAAPPGAVADALARVEAAAGRWDDPATNPVTQAVGWGGLHVAYNGTRDDEAKCQAAAKAARADLDAALDSVRALAGQLARAEGERGVEQLCDELRSAYAALRKFGRHEAGCRAITGIGRCGCGFDAARLGPSTPAPRPSAGPAAGYRTPNGCTRDCATNRGVGDQRCDCGAARASDDPAREALANVAKWVGHGCGDNSCWFVKPTGPGTNGGCRCVRRPMVAQSLANLYRALAAPAAPEVP